ncbi:MAG: type II toxin-antitoxin system HicB family antitoxin [Methanothrix sp.]|nr:type II toxin-antitoxin system HicB family antitoxin [Methanothrix sp.]
MIQNDRDGYFVFTQQLQGCYSQGDIYEEAIENIWDVVVLNVEDRLDSNEDLRHEGTDQPELSASGPLARRTPSPRVPPALLPDGPTRMNGRQRHMVTINRKAIIREMQLRSTASKK